MKKQNGITLISLIITIIIMLILAGVSLSMVMGDGSMLDQANAAVDRTAFAEVQEFVDLAVVGNKAAKYSNIGYQSKEDVADAMVAEGFITAEQKTAMMNNQEVKVGGQVLDYSGLNEAVTPTVKIEAKVYDNSGSIVSGAQIKIMSGTTEVATLTWRASSESYILTNEITDGLYNVVVSYNGTTKTELLNYTAGSTNNISITLPASGGNSGENTHYGGADE